MEDLQEKYSHLIKNSFDHEVDDLVENLILECKIEVQNDLNRLFEECRVFNDMYTEMIKVILNNYFQNHS